MPGPRVLFVNHTSKISGAEMVMLDIVPACSNAGAFLFEDGPLNASLDSCGVEVTKSRFGARFSQITRDSRLTKSLPLAGWMSAVVAELAATARRYDVVYANSQKAFVLGAIAGAISHRPLIWHLHDIISKAHFGAGQRRLQSRLANSLARFVIAPSQPVKAAFVGEGGRPDIVRVVPNGLEAHRAESSPMDLRRALDLTSKPLIGVFSRLSPWKGQHVVLRALADLPDVHCIIAGSALFGEHDYEKSLCALAKALGLANRVTFLGQRTDVPRLMQACDIVVHSSVDPEPFGRTLVEAMLIGTAVIATDAGAASEILGGGEAGTLVPPGDAVALAGAIRETLANAEKLGPQLETAKARAQRVLQPSRHEERDRRFDRRGERENAALSDFATMSWDRSKQIPGWFPAVVLIATTALIGPSLGAVARPLFVFASAAVGWFAWSRSPGAHLQAALALFSFAPLLRRLVDLSAGFDPSSIMIAGPLVALLAPLPELRKPALTGKGTDPGLLLISVYGACVVYSFLLTVAQGNWGGAISGGLKWGAPVIYALALYQRTEDCTALARDAAAAFAFILPAISLYGIYQYISPPLWDTYWMTQAAITSAGLPLPYEVRVFGTMHAPAAFGTYTATGILLVYLLRSAWYERLAVLPAVLALGLSLYRTAWISLAASILFCLLFRTTLQRAGYALFALAAGLALTLSLTFGEAVVDRLASLGDSLQDESAQERISEVTYLWNLPFSSVIGNGFIVTDTAVAGAAPLDGTIAVSWATMGIPVGLVCVSALILLIVRAVTTSFRDESLGTAALGALSCGWLVQLPLATIAVGELGFLFWIAVTLLNRQSQPGKDL